MVESTASPRPLVYAHLGDLHITDAKARNYLDLLAILAQLEVEGAGQLDFIYLPGDVADNGQPAQYRLVTAALRLASVPVHLITGDHDREPGSLASFYAVPAAAPLPKALTVQGVRCLFLDVCGPGTGGPDFRLGAAQLAWLREQLSQVPAGTEVALFMHTYPADLRDAAEREQLMSLLAQHRVALFDMGHTHYNELANDGTTIYAATRSTGQLEEGPVGYSLTSLDQGIVSWRFKPLDAAFPFVLITAPADYRLLRHASQAVGRQFTIRAIVLGANAVASVQYQLAGGSWQPMQRDAAGVWQAAAACPAGATLPLSLIVEARDATGRPGRHQVQLAPAPYQPPPRPGAGSDAARLGAWEDNGILGTQLGPNRNAKPLHPSS
ncbi:metallophosphoesterase family protein [Hymenobacter cheonanensis]|uniref:metallophosphoesterase family protein n=1 Tax=Hymenobacter sp. CA2-7 TaxID=3063993 RepID=UPI0027125517|nr:metallophosphoesterase [Hymenobacter sp. CA2-7]MDO7883923.1 metallophosphoesterase [Hymenobacter sp. CA2-7]